METEKKPKKTTKEFKELEKIIKLGTKLGIAEIKMGEVHVIFGDVQPAFRKPRKAVIRAQQENEQRTNLQEQADRVQDDISVSHVEDPLAFEEAIARGLLTDGDGAKEETDNHRTQ